jgi:hypothetical protein
MQQLSLFGAARPRPTLERTDPNGPVIAGPADVTLRLPHPRLAWDLAAIELHQHEDGRWMWAVHSSSGGYKVGPKWGRFAATQDAARTYAAGELLDWCDRNHGRTEGMSITAAQLDQIRAFAEGLL